MKKKDRQTIRLPSYDYTQPGAYFITLVTYERKRQFGVIVEGELAPSPLGRIAAEQWLRLPARFPNWKTDTFCVMPDHLHGILVKRNNCRQGAAGHSMPGMHKGLLRPDRTPESDSLGAIIRSYKSAVTLRWHYSTGMDGHPLWQRNYYEHVVRDDVDLQRIRRYILSNPLNDEDEKTIRVKEKSL